MIRPLPEPEVLYREVTVLCDACGGPLWSDPPSPTRRAHQSRELAQAGVLHAVCEECRDVMFGESEALRSSLWLNVVARVAFREAAR